MGGKGSGGDRGYNLPLRLTREMRKALTRLMVSEDVPDDFPLGLRVFRAGLLAYRVLDEEALQLMYCRGKIGDEEAQFLIEAHLCTDFRPVKVEALHQAAELKTMNQFFRKVLEQWDGLGEGSKLGHVANARKYPQLPNALMVVEAMRTQMKAQSREVET